MGKESWRPFHTLLQTCRGASDLAMDFVKQQKKCSKGCDHRSDSFDASVCIRVGLFRSDYEIAVLNKSVSLASCMK